MEEQHNKNAQLFFGIISSLGSQAWMQLGKIKNPMTDKIERDIPGATITIDMISMLKDKTEGNLSEEEKSFIDHTIKDLQMNYIVEKEKKDVARLHAMIELFETDLCLAKSLSAYFGEELDYNCQRCSVCIEKEPVKLLSSDLPSLDMLDFHDLVQQLTDIAESPLPVALVTRFLCGIPSPRLFEYKARQMASFSRLEAYPYKTVEKWVQLHNK